MGKLTLDEENHWVDWLTDAEVAERGRLEWGMLEHNEIEGFLPFEYVYIDNQIRFRYSYAAMRPLTVLFKEKQAGGQDCYLLLAGVLGIILRGQEYLLDERGYLLRPEWIFWNCQEKRAAVCYLPGEKNHTSEDFIRLVEFLMKHMEHKNTAMVEMVYALYDVLKADGLQAEKNLLMIQELQAKSSFLSSGGQAIAKGQENVKESFRSGMAEKEKLYTGKKGEKERRFFLKWSGNALTGKISCRLPEAVKLFSIAGEATVGRSEGCTHVLPFLQVSREQAVFSEEDGRLYLTDTASCNGTWLNGIRLSPGEKMECLPGDKVSFADITYLIGER